MHDCSLTDRLHTSSFVARAPLRAAVGAPILALAMAALGGCDDAAPDQSVQPQRGVYVPTGKADGLATCAEACGEQAQAGCWCDVTCADYGDCCPDYAPVCEGAEGDPISTDEAVLVADSSVARYYWPNVAPLYLGHTAYVPYLRDDISIPTLSVRRYVWDDDFGMVDDGQVVMPKFPSAIGSYPAGGLASVAGSLLSLPGEAPMAIPGLQQAGVSESAEGHVISDATGGRVFVSYEHGGFHTQIVDTRASVGPNLAGTMRGLTDDVAGRHVVTVDRGRVRVYDFGDPYAPELLTNLHLPGNVPHAILNEDALYVFRNAPEVEIRDGSSGTLLRTLPLPEVANRAFDRRDGFVFAASQSAVYVIDTSDADEPALVDAIELPDALGITGVRGLSGTADLLHVWATDQHWGSNGGQGNGLMRVVTWRLPEY